MQAVSRNGQYCCCAECEKNKHLIDKDMDLQQKWRINMKANKYGVKVTDENNKTTNYKVEITEDPTQPICNTPKKRKLVFSYLAFLFFFALMGTSFFVKCSTNKDEYKNNSSYEVSIDAVDLKSNVAILKKTDNIIPLICMTIFCTVGVVFVCLVLIKDDGGLRFYKLNSLISLKGDLDSKCDSEITEEECVNCPLTENISNTSVQKCSKILKKKNLYGEVTKNLMNSITEI